MQMPLTPETLPRHELAGLPVAVRDAPNADLVGVHGRTLRETTNTLIVRAEETDTTRRIPKRATTFRFELPDGTHVDVAGERLIARPARRTETRGDSPWV